MQKAYRIISFKCVLIGQNKLKYMQDGGCVICKIHVKIYETIKLQYKTKGSNRKTYLKYINKICKAI